MTKLQNMPIKDLETALENADGKRETQRLMVAIMYKRGPSVPMIAEWLDMRERTIYNWFDRLEDRSIEDAITDDSRSGRPPELDDGDREAFESAVTEPPSSSGYDQPAWSTKLARQFLQEEFDVDYSRRHITRLLHEAGLSPQLPGAKSSISDDIERTRYWK